VLALLALVLSSAHVRVEPQACAAEITRALGVLASGDAELSVAVERSADAWRLQLHRGDVVALSRSLSGSECRDVALAASVIIERYLHDLEAARARGAPASGTSQAPGISAASKPQSSGSPLARDPSMAAQGAPTASSGQRAARDPSATAQEPPAPQNGQLAARARSGSSVPGAPGAAGDASVTSRGSPEPPSAQLAGQDAPLSAPPQSGKLADASAATAPGEALAPASAAAPAREAREPRSAAASSDALAARESPTTGMPSGKALGAPAVGKPVSAAGASGEALAARESPAADTPASAPEASGEPLAAREPLDSPAASSPPSSGRPEAAAEAPRTPLLSLHRFEVHASGAAWFPSTHLANAGLALELVEHFKPAWRLGLLAVVSISADSTPVTFDSVPRGDLFSRSVLALLEAGRCFGDTLRGCASLTGGVRALNGWSEGSLVFQSRALWLARPTFGVNLTGSWLIGSFATVSLGLLGLYNPVSANVDVGGTSARLSQPDVEGLITLGAGFGIPQGP
jgi:hypothetical protein